MTDAPDRPAARFPESEVGRVRGEVAAVLGAWSLGTHDLLICGAARGGDLIAATAARSLGATVWALLAHPAEIFAQGSVAGSDPNWLHEFWGLLQHTPSWQLGDIPESASRSDVYAATNEWMLATAARQAHGTPPNLLAIWDGTGAGGTGGTADMVAEAKHHHATLHIINPCVTPA
jgi:hypothetical protein